MRLSLILSLIILMLVPGLFAADPGIRIGTYTDAGEFFAGVEILTPLSPQVYFNPNIEYVFVDYGDLMTLNLDVHYDFPTRSNMLYWVGAGLAVQYFDPAEGGDSGTNAGLNILGGLGLVTRGGIIPYAQAKVVVGDVEEFVLAVGLRF